MKPIVLTYYLPQFHEVEENNKWWGKGFTEWTNINDAVVYFPNQKIRKPIEPLGQYNLLNNNVIEEQFNIAKDHGVDGFLIWNYWFGNNDKILEKPLELILEKKLNVKYAVAWANHSWLNKAKGILLKEQLYLGEEDYIKYFEYLKKHFLSENYIKIDGKPVFTIFRPQDIPDLDNFMSVFNRLSISIGFNGIYWLAENTTLNNSYVKKFQSYFNSSSFLKNRRVNKITFILEKINNFTKGRINFGPFVYDYSTLAQMENNKKYSLNEIPVIFTGWDTSIRHKRNGIVLKNLTIKAFDSHVYNVTKYALEFNVPVIIIKSWNEWAEGNVLEPDSIFETKMLETVKKYLKVE